MNLRKLFLLTTIISVIIFTNSCFREQENDPRGNAYAGSEKCVQCHGAVSASYAHTAHFLSTREANENTVAGSFAKDSNELFINDSTRMMMEKRDSGLYQVLYIKNKEITARRFDLVMGCVKGQSFLSWYGTGLFQLPVSYMNVLQRWNSSPGYALADLKFNRSITKDCFECHSSFANRDEKGLSDFRLNPKSWVFTIDCERCHGPAAAHVQFQENHPDVKQSGFIIAFKTLSRQQKIDLCAVCHSGNSNILLKSRFAFKMGDTMTSYMIPTSGGKPIDVHGNQTQLLSQSKCFRMSNLDCTSCHNVHQSERGFLQAYNERCQHCHIGGHQTCGMETDSNRFFIQNNCVRCHMPEQSSGVIRVQAEASSTEAIPTMVVNHRIAVYPEETKRILETEFPSKKMQVKKIKSIK
jgi:Cytochrome c554 and c-prime